MNAISQREVTQAVKHFGHIAPYLKMPENDNENATLVDLARLLRNKAREGEEAASELLDLVLEHIDAYEKRIYTAKPIKSVDILKFLMEQHQLTQSDLPEIGSQSHVSKVLNGKRELTRNQIKALSKRFGVSPVVFFE